MSDARVRSKPIRSRGPASAASLSGWEVGKADSLGLRLVQLLADTCILRMTGSPLVVPATRKMRFTSTQDKRCPRQRAFCVGRLTPLAADKRTQSRRKPAIECQIILQVPWPARSSELPGPWQTAVCNHRHRQPDASKLRPLEEFSTDTSRPRRRPSYRGGFGLPLASMFRCCG
jgi:hypothetical protein